MDTKYYIDLHTHTTRSDGRLTPEELVDAAYQRNIRVLAITDHNVMPPDVDALQARHRGLTVLRGSEISSSFTFSDEEKKEIHVVGLMFDKKAPHLKVVFRKNNSQDQEEAYISEILNNLLACGIDIGSYDELRSDAKGRITRMTVAVKMRDLGFTSTIDEAFDFYIGDYGKKLAYVPVKSRNVSLNEAVEAILADGGVPILAHLYAYQLDPAKEKELLDAFSGYSRQYGCMETRYGKYTAEQEASLSNLANQYDLGPSAGSDYHGYFDNDSLAHEFPLSIYDDLLKRKRLLDNHRGA